MTDWVDDFADYIGNQFTTLNIYLEHMEPGSENCIVLKSEPGQGDQHFTGGRHIYRGIIVISVRDFDLETAKDTTKDLCEFLRLKGNITQGETYFERIMCNGYTHVKTSKTEGTLYSITVSIKYQR